MFGLIVYGSLLHTNEIDKYPYKIKEIIPINIHNFKRCFNLLPSDRVGIGNYKSVLNIEYCEKEYFNALCIIYEELSIELIDRREKGYKRIQIQFNNIEFLVSPTTKFQNIKIYTHMGYEKNIDSYIMPNVKYLKLCIEGSLLHGEHFHKMFIKTTHINGKNTLNEFINSNYNL